MKKTITSAVIFLFLSISTSNALSAETGRTGKVIDTDFSPASHTNTELTISTDTQRFRDWSDSVPAYNLDPAKSLEIYAGVDITADSGVMGGAGVVGVYTDPFNALFARPSNTAVNSRTQIIYLWDSNSFLEQGLTAFDESANSALSVTTRVFTGKSGGMRFIIRDGSTYYVANQTTVNVGQSKTTATLTGDSAGLQWAAFNPADFNRFADDDADLGFGSLTFSPKTFSNITGIGLIANATSATNTQIVISDFQATLTNGEKAPSGSAPEFFGLFTDNMVLQRNAAVAVYGRAEPGDEVTVTFGAQTVTAKTGPDGQWRTQLKPMPASFEPRTLTVSNANGASSVGNVLIGDVWLASGQSNMDHHFSTYSELSTEGLDQPNIRLLVHAKITSETPQETPVLIPQQEDQWQACTAELLEYFSPVAYFFGAKLQSELNVPIGLIESAWGGTIAEAWTPMDTLLKLGYKKTAAIMRDGEIHQNSQSVLYNGMIHPFRDFTFKGFIWYQGESNSMQALAYEELFSGMITSWRSVFGRGDLPFYFVQLAPYKRSAKVVQGHSWAWLRDAQTATLKLPNTGMAVITDLGEYEDIHPQNKKPVGERLALHALQVEGVNVTASSPMYQSMSVDGNQITVSFKYADTGLETRKVVMNNKAKQPIGQDPEAFVVPADKVAGFQICGEDQIFVDAEAKIDGKTVIVWADSVKAPVAVRYAWTSFPLCNLYSKEGLPVTPFRTDSFEAPSFNGAIRGKTFSGDTSGLGEPAILNEKANNAEIKKTAVAGRDTYLISPKGGKPWNFAYYKTEKPSLKNGKAPRMTVRILYFDGNDGEFELKYDSSDESYQQGKLKPGVWKLGKVIELENSGEWKLAELTLEDARFANNCHGYDFRLNCKDNDMILAGVWLEPAPAK